MAIELVDKDGFSIGKFENETTINNHKANGYKEVPVCEESFIKKKWDYLNLKWAEGATENEIIEHNRSLLPNIVSQRQLRTQLVLNGFNLDSIQTAINELTEPNKSIAQIAWDYAITFERDSPLLMCLASNLGLTIDEVDTIFLNASKL